MRMLQEPRWDQRRGNFTRAICASGITAAALALSVTASVAGQAVDPAHDIANRFSGAAPAESTKKSRSNDADTAARQRAYEEDMLARARAEAEARAREELAREEALLRERRARNARDAKAREEVERQRVMKEYEEQQARIAREREAIEAQQAEAKAEREAERLTAEREREQRRLADKLRQAREAAAARKAEEARIAAEAAAKLTAEREAEAAAQREQAQAQQRLQEEADARRIAAEAKRREEQQATKIAAEREAEAKARLAAEAQARRAAEAEALRIAAARAEQAKAWRLTRARDALAARRRHLADRVSAAERVRFADRARPFPNPSALGAPVATGSTGGDFANDARETEHGAIASTRATVLLVMTPGSRGIRRWNKSADPMLCVEGSCYISRGPALPADQVSRRKGFGPGIALGRRAGACAGSLSCVFRSVDLTAPRAWMQPVDLRVLRHDRRESRMVTADPTCAVRRGRLTCERFVESGDYRAWIIPEHVAREAGEAALEAALIGGLGSAHASAVR